MEESISRIGPAASMPADIGRPSSGAAQKTSIATKGQPVQQQSDAIKISQRAQVRLLEKQGLSVVEISARLGLDINTVTDYVLKIE